MDLVTMNDAVFNKALDADFHNVMKGVGFPLTPREYLTVGDMIRYHNSRENSIELMRLINTGLTNF